jgi:ArsR family transcriptional regulator, arsenate/arsenite/antimonite-responsive transcriptional repressor
MNVYMNQASINPVEFAKALADETRQEIMRLCCCRWMNVGEIVAALNVTQPTVSHHLAILRAADLVQARREGKQTYYTLNQQRIAFSCCALAEDFAPDHELTLIQPGA